MTTNKERLLNLFLDYVKIDSETCFEKQMTERVFNDLNDLNINCFQDDVGVKIGSNGNNIYAFIEGNKDYSPILITSHVDTVAPGNGIVPYIEDGFIKTKSDTVLGSDDKSGVATIIETLRTLKEKNIEHRPIEIAFTVREESGLLGSKNLDYSKFESKLGLALDGSGDIGSIYNIAPGQTKINATIIGKKSHAGVSPEKGISAIQVASYGVSQMNLLRIDEETTANIGSFIADYATNIVPERVEISAEARSINLEKLTNQTDSMVQCLKDACEKFGATIKYDVETAYNCFKIDENHEIINIVKDACKKLDLPVTIQPTGGGSDGSIFNQHGIDTIVLGTGMDKVHTTNEQISVKNLYDLSDLLLNILAV
ncbi:MAG: M20/M25/M40 family metallo-hydrolase [Oscillospiraceae bacterium]